MKCARIMTIMFFGLTILPLTGLAQPKSDIREIKPRSFSPPAMSGRAKA